MSAPTQPAVPLKCLRALPLSYYLSSYVVTLRLTSLPWSWVSFCLRSWVSFSRPSFTFRSRPAPLPLVRLPACPYSLTLVGLPGAVDSAQSALVGSQTSRCDSAGKCLSDRVFESLLSSEMGAAGAHWGPMVEIPRPPTTGPDSARVIRSLYPECVDLERKQGPTRGPMAAKAPQQSPRSFCHRNRKLIRMVELHTPG